MKNTFLLTFALILLAGSPLKAQEKEEAATLNKVVNTLKERITLAGYAQLGYTYDDAAKKMNTFDIKRIIFMAHGQITDRWTCDFMYDFLQRRHAARSLHRLPDSTRAESAYRRI